MDGEIISACLSFSLRCRNRVEALHQSRGITKGSGRAKLSIFEV